MGVPRLFPWLTRNFPDAVKYFQHGEYRMNVDNLYLDANGLLHGAAQEVYNYGSGKSFLNRYNNLSDEAKRMAVYELFMRKIIEMTQVVVPTKTLFIAIDGPAPLAKQAQQRERRFVSASLRKEEEEKTGKKPFDSNALTPGTTFMHELSQYMFWAIRNHINSSKDWKDIEVIFSPPTVPGEGEHKIMDYIRDIPEKKRNVLSHCLFGPDGDLIMLTLAAHVPNMYLFREDQFSIGFLHILDMGMVRKGLAGKLGQMKGVKSKKRNLNDVTNDFIVEGFFVGNDFLPKIQMFHLLEDGLEFMLDTYARTSRGGTENFLTIDNQFNIDGFTVFIESLARSERKFLIHQVTTSEPRKQAPEPKFRNETLLKHVHDISKPQDRQRRYKLDFEGYRHDYYLKVGLGSSKEPQFEEKLDEMCFDYLKSFVWVFVYYVRGLPAWKWAYRHHYAPLMKDFNRYLQSLTEVDEEKILSFNLQSPSRPFEQLLSVLPPYSVHLLPRTYQSLMLKKDSPLVKAGYYPKSFDIDYEGKFQDWQGVALLPFVDYDIIHKAYVKRTKRIKNPEKYFRNKIGTISTFKYDANYTAKFTSRMGNIDKLHVRKS